VVVFSFTMLDMLYSIVYFVAEMRVVSRDSFAMGPWIDEIGISFLPCKTSPFQSCSMFMCQSDFYKIE